VSTLADAWDREQERRETRPKREPKGGGTFQDPDEDDDFLHDEPNEHQEITPESGI
jgi:hypothetical protein